MLRPGRPQYTGAIKIATITGRFIFLSEEISAREITWLS